jgi:hypothetical protein
MSNNIVKINEIPKLLQQIFQTDQFSFEQNGDTVIFSPADNNIDYIDLAYGICKGHKLTVDKFLEMTREDNNFYL